MSSRMFSTSCLSILLLLTVKHVNCEDADTCTLEPWQAGPWGALLEDWATSPRERTGRIMALPPTRGYYVTDRIGLAPPPPPAQQYEEWPMTPPPPPSPGKIVNRPPNPYKDHFKPSPQYPVFQGPPPSKPQPPQRPPIQHQQALDQRPQQSDHRPQQQTDHSPQQQADHRPQQQTDHRPQQQTEHSPQQQTDHRPQQQTDHRPQLQTDHRPQQQTDHRPQQQTDHIPQQHTDYRPQQQTDQRPQKPDQRPKKPNKKPQHPNTVDRIDNPPQRKEVSETDLYLLGAIEKLVYRVDLMEKRLRKMEESMHYLVAGKDKSPEPCMTNFTRVGGRCYHFAAEATDWKTANLACRKLRSNLLELETDKERLKFTAGLLSDRKIRDLDWWTGGLNPGLLWIWSNSARQILANSTTSSGVASSASSDVTIVGDGRCLALVYDAAARGYVYRGQECALRHRYVCEKEEDKTKLSNEIERVAKTLKLVESRTRKSKVLWTDDEQPAAHRAHSDLNITNKQPKRT